jgi:hypothetical protein
MTNPAGFFHPGTRVPWERILADDIEAVVAERSSHSLEHQKAVRAGMGRKVDVSRGLRLRLVRVDSEIWWYVVTTR